MGKRERDDWDIAKRAESVGVDVDDGWGGERGAVGRVLTVGGELAGADGRAGK